MQGRRNMIKRILLSREKVLPYDNSDNSFVQPLELEYYITESPPDRYMVNEEETVYGMSVVKKAGEGVIEEEFIRNYSCSRKDAENVVKILAANKVTPLELPYIIDDLLGV